MASILMGVITAILIILICGVVFFVGYKVGISNQPKIEQSEKTTAEINERNKEIMQGMANILNHANRHGVKKN